MKAWFDFWDTDGNGSLDQQEVQRALMKTFCIGGDVCRVQTMRETLEAVWVLFDIDGNNSIDIHEFTMANGLGETLLLSLRGLHPMQKQFRRTSSQTSLGG